MVESRTIHPQPRRAGRDGVLHGHRPTLGASLVTGALVVGAVVGGGGGYWVGNAITHHRHGGRQHGR